jgi:hypothetical protein
MEGERPSTFELEAEQLNGLVSVSRNLVEKWLGTPRSAGDESLDSRETGMDLVCGTHGVGYPVNSELLSGTTKQSRARILDSIGKRPSKSNGKVTGSVLKKDSQEVNDDGRTSQMLSTLKQASKPESFLESHLKKNKKRKR